ncbi:MAG: AAA family ATPase, partial [Deltaproteobacteria bacterium]|nr:AAA family ATPase [Deltaproteobacteria bacterium]
MSSNFPELSPEELRYHCDESQFDFESTAELPSLPEMIGQERALRAIDFGISIPSQGFNIYALGPAGSGKTSVVKQRLQEHAKQLPVPDDWCYVQNFTEPHKPKYLRLVAGKGVQLRNDVEKLIEELKREIPQALESENYEDERNRIVQELQRKRTAESSQLEQKAQERDFTLRPGASGAPMLVPLIEGEPMTPEKYSGLTEDERRQLEEKGQGLQIEMNTAMRAVQAINRAGQEQLAELERNVAMVAVGHLINDLTEKYAEFADVVNYLEAVQKDVVEHVSDFKPSTEEGERGQFPFGMMMPRVSFERYSVNVIVDNSETAGAPVIIESNPNYHRLLGRTERQAQFGALVTNFTMIKPGALHRANGGYLVLEAENTLRNPFAYNALKRAMKDNEIRITDLAEEMSIISTITLEPQPIPLDVKVVLIGSPMLYYLLESYDGEFGELFKVQADFDMQMERTDENMRQYAQFLKTHCDAEELPHLDRGGVAQMIEYSVELTRDQTKLSARFADICDMVRESAYWARQNGDGLITHADVQKAIDEKIYRSNRIEERLQEMIERGQIFISTEGEVVGQVNGLSVMSLGRYAFGKPSRITARTYMGRGGVVNIEREVRMSGPIHNKGVMILSGYLNGTYGQDKPISMSAQIGFEQLYEGVEGDSASSTELYALLSSLSGFPIKQGIAVTGSVNQHGEIQPIGGVTEKIGGFFEVCKAFGLTGEQGVLIPKSNVTNLMLKPEVIDAVRDGKFRIYPVETIDQGIAVLTGKEAGERQEDGTYPEGTVNWAVEEQLADYAENIKQFEAKE